MEWCITLHPSIHYLLKTFFVKGTMLEFTYSPQNTVFNPLNNGVISMLEMRNLRLTGNHLLAEFSVSLSQPLSPLVELSLHLQELASGSYFGAESCLPCHFLLAPPGNTWSHQMGPSVPITSQQIDGETMETVTDFIFLGSKITADGDCSHEIKRRLLLGRKAMTNLDSILKSRDITLPTKVCLVKAMVFLVVLYGCESWTIKKALALWCWRRLLRASPFDYKESKSVSPKGNQSWIFIWRTDAEAEAPILWPPDGKNWLVRKDPDAGKDWKREVKGMTEDEMVGWHHRLNGHDFEQTLGVDDGQGGLTCCSPWGPKSRTWLSDWTELSEHVTQSWANLILSPRNLKLEFRNYKSLLVAGTHRLDSHEEADSNEMFRESQEAEKIRMKLLQREKQRWEVER